MQHRLNKYKVAISKQNMRVLIKSFWVPFMLGLNIH